MLGLAFTEALMLGIATIHDTLRLMLLSQQSTHELFSWDDISPKRQLEWHRCFNSYQCARLRVPMDWQKPTFLESETVDIAVIKLEAKVPVTDPTYGGVVILNPGGPGASGVRQILTGGHHIQTILSPREGSAAEVKHFDVLSFDPRGVNNTRPNVYCFSNRQEAGIHEYMTRHHVLRSPDDGVFDYIWNSKRAIAASCSARESNQNIIYHMNTAPVARDIIEIVEQHGQWREAHAKRILENGHFSDLETERTLNSTAYKAGQEPVQYWGFSYGTVLGATLAATSPTRIKRMVLDGVVDSVEYMSGRSLTSLRDTDRLLDHFAVQCMCGGQQNCPLARLGNAGMIVREIERLMQMLRSQSLAVMSTGDQDAGVVTYADLMHYIEGILYSPLQTWPEAAQVFDQLSRGNGSMLLAVRQAAHTELTRALPQSCTKERHFTSACFDTGISTLGLPDSTPIRCSDGLGWPADAKPEFLAYIRDLMQESKLLGALWAEIQMPCTAWQARAAWRYEGDFEANTSNPILFVGNTFDPVTPLHSAITMAAKFRGSSVLEIAAAGHCSSATVSLCAGRRIREYFQTGRVLSSESMLIVDSAGVRIASCDADRHPFDGSSEIDPVPDPPTGGTDIELWRALNLLSGAWGSG